MFDWLWRYFCGWQSFCVAVGCRSILMDLLWQEEIPFWHERKRGDSVSVRISRSHVQKLEEAALARCMPYTMLKRGGFSELVKFCRKRPGIPAGLVLLCLWCLYSQNLIWNIEVEGCENLSETYIEEILTAYGCGVGEFYPAIDFDALHSNISAWEPEIAWLSVYMHGTTAEVQLRETKPADPYKKPEGVYANVVAAEAGEVVIAEVEEGQATVRKGDIVLPGDMLISGVVPMRKEGQTRLEYAKGTVLAKVACPITVEVTRKRLEKSYTGREKTEKSVKIFKNTINLFANTGIPYTTYDTINKMEQVCLFETWSIPVTVCTTVYREYEMLATEVSPERAAEEALMEMRQKMDASIGTGELLSQSVTVTTTEEGNCRIDCLLYLLRDIAVTEEFTAGPDAKTPLP